MNIEEYQQRAVATALPTALNYDYLIPGLVAEVGEVFGKVAKSVRDEWSRERLQEELKAELGDVYWFYVLICHVAGQQVRLPQIPQVSVSEQELLGDLLKRVAGVQDVSLFPSMTSDLEWLLELFPSYIARVAKVYEIDMQEILEYNIEKLESRKARGKLKGNGDLR